MYEKHLCKPQFLTYSGAMVHASGMFEATPFILIDLSPFFQRFNAGHSKYVLFIRQDNFFPIRAIHWIKEDKKVKYMEVKKLALIDNIWIAEETTVKTTKTKKP